MVLEITKAGAEFARAGHPDKRTGKRCGMIRQLTCIYAKLAQVIADHGGISDLVSDKPSSPESRGV